MTDVVWFPKITSVQPWEAEIGSAAPAFLISTAGNAQAVWRHTVTGQNPDGSMQFDPGASAPVRAVGDIRGIQPGAFFDFEAPQGQQVAYGVRRDRADFGPYTLGNAGTWLIPVFDPNLCAPLHIANINSRDFFGDFATEVTQAVVQIPGRPNPITIDFGRSNATYSLNVVVQGAEQRVALKDCLQRGGVYFLSCPPDQWPTQLTSPYVTVGQVNWKAYPDMNGEVWTLSLPLTPSDRPEGAAREQQPGFAGLPSSFAALPDSFGALNR